MIHLLTEKQQEFLHELGHAGSKGLPLCDVGAGARGSATWVRKPLLLTGLVERFQGQDGVDRIRLSIAGKLFVEATLI